APKTARMDGEEVRCLRRPRPAARVRSGARSGRPARRWRERHSCELRLGLLARPAARTGLRTVSPGRPLRVLLRTRQAARRPGISRATGTGPAARTGTHPRPGLRPGPVGCLAAGRRALFRARHLAGGLAAGAPPSIDARARAHGGRGGAGAPRDRAWL